MRVLLSIKPEFANKIFDGTKRFEFRRALFKNTNVTKVLVYASSPVQMVIGEFEIERLHEAEPAELWRKTRKHSGITEEFFFSYFHEKETAFAIEIKSPKLYKKPLCLATHFDKKPPQSFLYLL